MPARTIQVQLDRLGGTGAGLARKCRQLRFKEGNADTGRQMEAGTPRGGMHNADEIAPGEAVAYQSHGPLTNRSPDPTEKRLEPA